MGQDILGALLKILGLEHKVLLNSVLHHLASKFLFIKVMTKMHIFPDFRNLRYSGSKFVCLSQEMTMHRLDRPDH